MRWRVGRRPAVRSRAFTALIGQEAGLFCGQGIWSAWMRGCAMAGAIAPDADASCTGDGTLTGETLIANAFQLCRLSGPVV